MTHLKKLNEKLQNYFEENGIEIESIVNFNTKPKDIVIQGLEFQLKESPYGLRYPILGVQLTLNGKTDFIYTTQKEFLGDVEDAFEWSKEEAVYFQEHDDIYSMKFSNDSLSEIAATFSLHTTAMDQFFDLLSDFDINYEVCNIFFLTLQEAINKKEATYKSIFEANGFKTQLFEDGNFKIGFFLEKEEQTDRIDFSIDYYEYKESL